METEEPNQKKNPSYPKQDGLKPKAIKKEEEAPNQKRKKIHLSLNPTELNQRQ